MNIDTHNQNLSVQNCLVTFTPGTNKFAISPLTFIKILDTVKIFTQDIFPVQYLSSLKLLHKKYSLDVNRVRSASEIVSNVTYDF